MTRLFGIYGASGCGRGIMPLARSQLADLDVTLVFIDDALAGNVVNGHEVVSLATFCDRPALERRVAVAVAHPAVRASLVERCEAAEISFFQVRAQNSVIMDEVSIAEGAMISPFVTFTSNIRVGRHFHANINSYVEHDCVIGDFVTFAPGVHCNGNVWIGDGAYIGSGAIVRQGLPDRPLVIGAGAVIGMGAIVIRDVEPAATVAGNPARVIKLRQ